MGGEGEELRKMGLAREMGWGRERGCGKFGGDKETNLHDEGKGMEGRRKTKSGYAYVSAHKHTDTQKSLILVPIESAYAISY